MNAMLNRFTVERTCAALAPDARPSKTGRVDLSQDSAWLQDFRDGKTPAAPGRTQRAVGGAVVPPRHHRSGVRSIRAI